MMKKIIAVIATVLMIFGVCAVPVSAAMGEVVVNGDFEKAMGREVQLDFINQLMCD